MIQIIDKRQCCGCGACGQVCPKRCIAMEEDEEGFLYPQVDAVSCIHCRLCENVCPVIHEGISRIPVATYAAIHPYESIRLKSSSGGIFAWLATQVLKEGGIVFGAAFDKDWSVKHIAITHVGELNKLCGSKYLQSRIEKTFREVECYLKKDRMVLFSGTPCQVAGLRRFLHREYDNLLTVDVICHGVPSPKVWRSYLAENYKHQAITGIDFRDKRSGWKHYSMTITTTTSTFSSTYAGSDFMGAFLMNLTLRPSCYSCPAKKGKSGGDLTLGDFWGVDKLLPQMDDDKGTGVVMIYTEKGAAYLRGLDGRNICYQDVVRHNFSIECSVNKPVNRGYFFQQLEQRGFNRAWKNTTSKNFLKRVERKLFRLL